MSSCLDSVEGVTVVHLSPDVKVLQEDGSLVAITELRAGTRVLCLDHTSDTFRLGAVLGFRPDEHAAFLVEGEDVAVFITGNQDWGRQCLPICFLQKLPQVGPEKFGNIGSRNHHCGLCAPCPWSTARGCVAGVLCGYCHHEHAGLTRSARRRLARSSCCASIAMDVTELVDASDLALLAQVAHRESIGDRKSVHGSCPYEESPAPEESPSMEESPAPGARPWVLKNTFVHIPALNTSSRLRARSAPPRACHHGNF